MTKENEGDISSENIIGIFEKYQTSPEEIDEYHALLMEWQHTQEKYIIEQLTLGILNFNTEELPSVYAPEGFSDIQLFDILYGNINKIKQYPDDIQRIIENAQRNLSEFRYMGFSDNSYTCLYQKKIIELYSQTRDNVVMELEYVRGWNEYFAYDTVNIIIFTFLLIISTVIFIQEKQTGMIQLIYVSRKGRMTSVLAKLFALLIINCITVTIFSAETLAIYSFRLGLSNPNNAIQILSEFTYSYNIITIGEYLLITLAVKCLAFSVFTLIVATVSVFVYNYIITFICGLGVLGINYYLYSMRYLNADSPVKYLNLLSTTSVTTLFTRFRATNILNKCIGYQTLLPFVYGVIIFIIITAATVKYCSGYIAPDKAINIIIHKPQPLLFTSRNGGNRKTCLYSPKRLFVYETYKSLISSRYIFIVIILITVKILLSYNLYQPTHSYADAVYQEYMTTLAGEMTDEKRLFINQEREMINNTLAEKVVKQQEYLEKAITYDEYIEYLKEYNYAYSRNDIFKDIEAHAAYIDSLKNMEKEAWFVYDTGWKKLFQTPYDWTFYFCLLLILCCVFSSEYESRTSEGAFVHILRTAKRGRIHTFNAKLKSSVIISLTLTVIWNLIDVVWINQTYLLPIANAPLISIELFKASNLEITISGYIVLLYAVRITSSLIYALFVSSLSCLFGKALTAAVAACSSTIIPSLMNRYGIDFMQYADHISFVRVTPMIISGSTQIISYMITFILLSAFLLILSRKKWLK